MVRLALIVGSALVAILVVAVAVSHLTESPHDKDLRECQERYPASSQYALTGPGSRQESREFVAACMRGRGY
jgi:hypothetical protein